MRGHTNDPTPCFMNMLVLLNLPFLVAAQSVTVGLKHGGSTTEVVSTSSLHDPPPPPPSPIVIPTGHPDTSSPTFITASTSSSVSPSSTSISLGSTASTHTRLSPGAIAGIVVSAVVPCIFAIGFLFYCRKRRHQILPGRPINLTVDLDPIGSPVYEKQLMPTPFVTDTEAVQLGYDQPTKRIGARFTTADRLSSPHTHARLSVISNQFHTSLPVLLANSGYSMEPPRNSRSTLATQRPDTPSSEYTLTEESPPLHEHPHDASHDSHDITEEGIARVL